jgi:hypothetical protein
MARARRGTGTAFASSPLVISEYNILLRLSFMLIVILSRNSAWVVPKDISKLQQHEIQAYIEEPFKKSGELLAGYKIALDPKKWEEEREALRAQAAEEEANAEVDQLEESETGDGVEEDDEEKKPKGGKKRKRDSDAAAPKSKAKATKAKKESAEPKKKAAGPAKSKKNGVKSKAMVESEDDAAEAEDEDAGPSKKTSPPPTKKAKRGEKEEDDADCESSYALSPYRRRFARLSVSWLTIRFYCPYSCPCWRS